ncbi:MAG TPA: tail fiber protein [Azospirillum sp.]
MDNFVGEIRLMPFNWAPSGWVLCQGQLLTIQQNIALYSLIGTLYGGDGKTTFAVPDLRGRVPVHRNYNNLSVNTQFQVGTQGGAEQVTLTQAQVPSHLHSFGAYNGAADQLPPLGNLLAQPPAVSTISPPNLYSTVASTVVTLDPSSISVSGSSAAHPNVQPFIVLNYMIATTGIYPSRD